MEQVAALQPKLDSSSVKDQRAGALKLQELSTKSGDTQAKVYYLKTMYDEYVRLGDAHGALSAAQQLEKVAPTDETAAEQATSYEQLNDQKNAAKWWGIAATRVPRTNDPHIQSAYNDYLARQQRAEKGHAQ